MNETPTPSWAEQREARGWPVIEIRRSDVLLARLCLKRPKTRARRLLDAAKAMFGGRS